MLKLLLYCVLLQTVFAQVQSRYGFGTSYLKNSRLCYQWTCLNSKLGLPDALPPKEQYSQVLKDILPPGPWQDVIKDVVDKCFGDRPRSYVNTCPGQALLHCTVDHLIQFCPERSLRKDDACAPLQTLAGFKYMFSQSRYQNLEKHLPAERRPAWFLKNYFSSKCCELPSIFKSDVLETCGFTTFMFYNDHQPNHGPLTLHFPKQATTTQKSNEDLDEVNVVDINENLVETTPKSKYHVNIMDISQSVTEELTDPLDCCDLSGFIEPSWRSECGLQVSWDKDNRLSIKNTSVQVSTTVAPTTVRPGKMNDVKVIPQSCEKSTCVFKKLNIISENGSLDLDSFSKLLDNMTLAHTSWTKAKARVVTKCLRKPLIEYYDECDINKILACTFDVLSENCPHAKKHDPCRHSTILNDDITCQISSTKLRPKNRRQFCGLPNMVNHNILLECDLNSLTRMEYVPDPVTSKPKTHWWTKSQFACKGSTDSIKCLLNKMGVLNKYGFLDYFKMKDRIRSFAAQDEAWFNLSEVYLNTFASTPMYGKQCSTPKKFLNAVDAMLMTCPMSKRKLSLQCNRILTDMANTPAQNMATKFQRLRQHFQHVYNSSNTYPLLSYKFNITGHLLPRPLTYTSYGILYPNLSPPSSSSSLATASLTDGGCSACGLQVRSPPVTHKNPTYEFGILNSKDAPKVEIIDVRPTATKSPLEILPVYLKMRLNGRNASYTAPMRDGVWRSAPIQPPMPNMP